MVAAARTKIVKAVHSRSRSLLLDLEHRKLVLDIGATFSVLRAALSKPDFSRRPAQVVNLGQVLQLDVVDASDFQLGPIKISPLPVMLNPWSISARRFHRLMA